MIFKIYLSNDITQNEEYSSKYLDEYDYHLNESE